MKLLYCFCFLVFGFVANGQKILKGVVLDESNKPVPNASIFVNRTSIGATSDEQGNFVLKIPHGRCTLVAAGTGFTTKNQIININDLSDKDTIILQSKTLTRKIYKQEYEWSMWGSFFLSNFLGTSIYAHDCKIKNIEALYFRSSESQISVFADEPLIIENRDLGYTIKYYLESFAFNAETGIIRYGGYAFFQVMEGSAKKQKNWDLNRSEAYFGSLMHFMRSIYRNQLEEEGFNVRPLKKVRNVPIFQTNNNNVSGERKILDSINNTATDSTDDYEDQILNEDNYRDVIGSTLPGDSIAYMVSKTTAGLDFNNFLLVTYMGKEALPDYQGQSNGTSMTSQLLLINKRPIEIESNGNFYYSLDLLLLGYWLWAEKIANILPYDYNPPKAP